MAKFKQFTCPPNYALKGGFANPHCECNKKKVCGHAWVGATPVAWGGGGGGGDKGRGPSLVRSIAALSGLDAAGKRIQVGTAPRHANAKQFKRPRKRAGVSGILNGLDDLSDLGATDVPAAIKEAGGAVTSIVSAITGKAPAPTPTPRPGPVRDDGLPSWVIPTAIAGVVVIGGIALFKGLKKKR